jgi:hypothetical protein
MFSATLDFMLETFFVQENKQQGRMLYQLCRHEYPPIKIQDCYHKKRAWDLIENGAEQKS